MRQYKTADSPPPIVVWLRPFDLTQGFPDFDFQQVITTSSENLATVVTLRDTRTRSSNISRYAEYKFYLGIFTLLVTASVAAFTVSIVWAACPTLFFVVWQLICFWSTRKKNDRPLHKVVTKLRTDQPLVITPSFGVQVFSCSNENWRKRVREIMGIASAAIIDLTDLSEALVWEFDQSLSRLGAERIVIAYRIDDEYPSTTPEEVVRLLRSREQNSARVLFYPRYRRSKWADKTSLTARV